MGFASRLTALLLWYRDGFLQRPVDIAESFHTIQSLSAPLEAAQGSGVINGATVQESCNTSENRQCWSDGFNVKTDYETETPPGEVKRFILDVTNEQISPDGYNVSRLLFNNSYPGPTLEGNWGDTFEITVRNKLKNFNGTSIHWHGIRQLKTNWMDGVAGITECPLPVSLAMKQGEMWESWTKKAQPGEDVTYRWRATQYGTSWYHSHFSLQYPDGLVGALKINGPTSMNYDFDLGPVLLTDHFHKTAFSQVQLEYLGRPPAPDSMLMSGRGVYHCCPKLDPLCIGNSSYTEFQFTAGKTYKMSIVNTGVSTHMTFWIDNHDFHVVAADFVPIKPYKSSILNIAIGQRYDIIVHAKADTVNLQQTDFWIHARDCSNGGARSELGIIRYNSSSTTIPWTPPPSQKQVCYGCLDELSTNLQPIVRRNVTAPANSNYKSDSFKVSLVGYPDEFDKNSMMHKWVLKDSSLYVDWSQPSLSLVKIASDRNWSTPRFPRGYEPVILDYDKGSWVYFMIEGKFNESLDNSTRKIYKNQAPVAHPIHLHGHDFVVLATGTTEYNGTDIELDLQNPPRRDVALLPVNGYLVIAFQVDNPGIWLMHCHLAWHASGGLGLQFVESPGEIGPLFDSSGIMPKYSETCANWGAYYTVFNREYGALQDDSGI